MSEQSHPANMTDAELREWHQHIRTAIRAGTHWESAHHRADRFIEMGRERQGGKVSEPAPYDPGPLPEWAPPLHSPSLLPKWAPPLPEGAVYLGSGCARLEALLPFAGWCCCSIFPHLGWTRGRWTSISQFVLYAVPADSEAARALGLGGAK